jgi:DNA-binding ferritin-like protein (Dps family)
MSKQLLEVFKQIKGVDVAKIQKLLDIHEERRIAMVELSAILGQDVSFSEDEMLQNIADHYALEIMKDMEKQMMEVLSNG